MKDIPSSSMVTTTPLPTHSNTKTAGVQRTLRLAPGAKRKEPEKTAVTMTAEEMIEAPAGEDLVAAGVEDILEMAEDLEVEEDTHEAVEEGVKVVVEEDTVVDVEGAREAENIEERGSLEVEIESSVEVEGNSAVETIIEVESVDRIDRKSVV